MAQYQYLLEYFVSLDSKQLKVLLPTDADDASAILGSHFPYSRN